jgi:hypothetical protein
VIAGYPNIDFRFIVIPTKDLPTRFFPIFASTEEIEMQLKIGEEDTTELIRKYYEKQKQDGTYKPYVPKEDLEEPSSEKREESHHN